MGGSPEIIADSKRNEIETTPITPEVLDRLAKEREKNAEKSMEGHEERKEQARAEAIEAVNKVEKIKDKNEHEQKTPSIEKHVAIGKKHKDESYKRTIKRVQSELPTTQRVFSKIIHNNAIEKTSEVIGNSIARPASILYGGICAFIITLATYYVSKKIGYTLSGSETIVAFSVGWLIGLIIDYLKLLFSKRR